MKHLAKNFHVVALIGITAGMALKVFSDSRDNANRQSREKEVDEVINAIEDILSFPETDSFSTFFETLREYYGITVTIYENIVSYDLGKQIYPISGRELYERNSNRFYSLDELARRIEYNRTHRKRVE